MTEAASAASTAAALLSPWVACCIGVLLVLAAMVTAYLWQSGVFSHIEVGTKAAPFGEMTVAYKTGKGPYKNAFNVFAEISSLFGQGDNKSEEKDESSSPSPMPCVGIYYDDPESVPEEDLRYAVGAVLATTDSQEMDTFRLETLIEAGFKLAVLPKQQFAVVSSFPLRTALSLYVAIFRVYPRLRAYIAEQRLCAYPAIEITDGATMHFMMPLSRQEEFFVSEFSEEQVSIATTEMSTTLPDQSSLLDDDLLRTSSRNSDRKSCEVVDKVFVKPTKPAPKKKAAAAAAAAAAGDAPVTKVSSLKNRTDDEVIPEGRHGRFGWHIEELVRRPYRGVYVRRK